MTNPNFTASISTNELYRDLDTTVCLTDLLDGYDSDIAELQDAIGDGGDYADADHTHSEYALNTTVNALQDAVVSKADLNHVHDEYALSIHTHNDYAPQSALDSIEAEVEGKADSTHSHTIANVSNLQSELDALESAISGKANSNHTHTIDTALSGTSTNPVQNKVINSALSGKANVSHGNHVPATQTANNAVFLRNDNTWATVTPSNIGAYTKSEIDSKVSTLNTAINGRATSSHTHDDRYYTEAEVDARFDAIVGEGASTTLDTIGEISAAIEDNQDMLDTLNSAIGTKANASSLTSHTNNKSNPHGVTAAQVGAYTKAEVDSKLSGKADSDHTHTVDSALSGTSINPVQNKVVKSALDGKANTSHGNHVPTTQTADNTKFLRNDNTWQSVTPANIGAYTKSEIDSKVSTLNTAINGKAASDHTHTAATTSAAGLMSAADKSKLDGIAANANNYTYTLPSAGTSLGGVKTGGDVSISNGVITVNDDSHNHVISNIDGLQSALDAKSSTSHTHTAEALVLMAEALFGTNYQGGVEYSYGSGSGKNVLTEISNMPQGFHTIYAIAGTTGNPETTESYRYFIHKTSTTIGWIYAFGADGSIYSNYLAGANIYKGWRTIHDAKRKPLWTGSYYMTAGHTATPSKKLSQCEHGWLLMWSDYDPDTSTVNNSDFCTTMIPNRNWAGNTWNGSSFYCDVPRYSAGTATDSESRVIKVLTVYDNKLVGSENNNAAPRNDVILRAIYEF